MIVGNRTQEEGLPELAGARLPQRLWETVFTFARRKPVGAAGGVILVVLVVIAITAPWISPYDPFEIFADNRKAPPQIAYPLGTDQLGRDVMSRIFYGARISLYVGLISVAAGISLGFVLGAVSAYIGGTFDLLFQRVVDAMIAFPGIILALTLIAVLGSSVNNVIYALVAVLWPGASRTIRSQVLSLKEMDYVLAARAIGMSPARIVVRHIMPNCFALYIILATITLGTAIITEASLSFLGLGIPGDVPSWGGMLARASQEFIKSAPWIALSSGIAIALAVFAVNLLGDALRDVLDPKLRGR